MDMQGKVALVTGGSTGVGLALAKLLVSHGTHVVLVARSQDALLRAVAELGSDHASWIALDVSDRAALAELPRHVVDKHGRIDFVINNAGVNHRGPVAERSAAELTQIIEVNLLAPILLTHAALPFLERGGGILNVASLAGKIPVPHEATYSASKAGLRAFSAVLEGELAERGIRVTTICPGPVDTGFIADVAHIPDLVFSQPMSSAEQVAEIAMAALASGDRERDVPWLSGKLATLGYVFPGVMKHLRPVLERRGARNKRRHVAARAR